METEKLQGMKNDKATGPDNVKKWALQMHFRWPTIDQYTNFLMNQVLEENLKNYVNLKKKSMIKQLSPIALTLSYCKKTYAYSKKLK